MKCFIGVVAINQKEDSSKGTQREDEEVEGDEVFLAQEPVDLVQLDHTGEGVESYCRKQSPQHVQVDLPSNVPLLLGIHPVRPWFSNRNRGGGV